MNWQSTCQIRPMAGDHAAMERGGRVAAPGIAVLAAAAAVVGSYAGGGPGTLLARVLSGAVLVAGWWSVRRASAPVRDDPTAPWIWFARGSLVMGAGTVAEPWAAAVLGSGSPFVAAWHHLAPVVASMLVYQGIVRWNRYRVGAVAPQDWVNGTGALLALAAVVHAAALARILDADTASPLPALQIAGPVLVAATMATVAPLAGLRRDPRSWLTLGAFVLIGAATVAAVTDPHLEGLRLGTWTAAGGTCIAWARHGARLPRGRLHPASAIATAAGSIVVLAVSVTVVAGEHAEHLVAAMAGGAREGRVWPVVLSSLAAAAAIFRLAAMVRDQSLLSTSRREARTDELTGLGNRRALSEQVARLVEGGAPTCLILVDLDDFKEVNDRHGHPVGDELLRTVAAALEQVTPTDGLAARMGGDEFAMVVPGDAARAGELAHRVAAALAGASAESRREVGASIGVTAGLGSAADLLWQADVALYEAKRRGGEVVAYDDLLGSAARSRRQLTEELRHAFVHGRGEDQFVVWYQPQVVASTGRVSGVEALVRWAHPTRGLVSPGTFLPLVEDAGLMPALTAHVLLEACGWAAHGRGPGGPARVSVNLAPSVIAGPDAVSLVVGALEASGLPPSHLTVEVTEAAFIVDDERAIANATALRDRGIALSIDDYGTGYSSLARLHRLPIAELKLDRQFTHDLELDERARVIVSATIDLAHRLGHRVVAEGVEDRQTLDLLTELGCDEIQGWIHAPAMSTDDLEAWLASRRGGDVTPSGQHQTPAGRSGPAGVRQKTGLPPVTPRTVAET